MNIRNILLSALLFFLAANANAIMSMQLSDSADYSSNLVSDDDGTLAISGAIAKWSVNTSGISSDEYTEVLHLNSANSTGGVGTVYIRTTETNNLLKLDEGTSLNLAAITPTDTGEISGLSQDIRVVPEPATLTLLGIGLLGFGIIARRNRKNA